MPIKFPCGVCKEAVAKCHRAVQCDLCDCWVHIKCNFIDKKSYIHIIEENWFCKNCIQSNFPFISITNEMLTQINQGKSSNINPTNPCNITFFDEINSLCNEENSNINSKYYTPSELNKIKNIKNELSFFHLNISSLGYHFDELQTLLNCTKTKFDFIGITETRHKTNINLNNYNIIECPSESIKGGVLIYIKKNIPTNQEMI